MCDIKWQWAEVLSQAIVAMTIQRGAVTVPQTIYGRKVKEIGRALPMRLYVFIVTGIFWVCFISVSFFSFSLSDAWVDVGAGFHFCRLAEKGKSEFESQQDEREVTCFPVWSLVSRNSPTFTFITQ